MKEIDELVFLADVRYTDDHEWVRPQGGTALVGISDYAQDQLGDIVFVELPEIGATFAKGEEFGTIESVKAVSELYMPVGGKIVNVNATLEDSPELVNNTPYGDGWMLEIEPSDPTELETLMTKDPYIEMIKGLDS